MDVDPPSDVDPQIRRLVARVFRIAPEDVRATSSPATIPAWDSMAHLELVMALESEFGAQLGPEEILEVEDVASVQRLLVRLGAVRASA